MLSRGVVSRLWWSRRRSIEGAAWWVPSRSLAARRWTPGVSLFRITGSFPVFRWLSLVIYILKGISPFLLA